MKIYIAHSRDFDYVNELYKPIRNDLELNKYDIILPHEKGDNYDINIYQEIDLLIAIVDYPSTGLGIELGLTYNLNKKIYCLYKNNYSKSIKAIVKDDHIIKYHNLIDTIKEIINKESL